VHFVDGQVHQVVASRPDATAHRVTRTSDRPPIVTALPATQPIERLTTGLGLTRSSRSSGDDEMQVVSGQQMPDVVDRL